jgi:hypothetical protein
MSELSSAHLQLCVNDLLHPTEKSESLLEALTSSQLEEIEKTLSKIKEKKQSSPQQLGTVLIIFLRNPLTHILPFINQLLLFLSLKPLILPLYITTGHLSQHKSQRP